MPNELNTQPVYLTTGNPDTMNDAALYAGGQLGERFAWRDREYQIVRADSGATSATATGAVAANQLAFWKDKDKLLVTNNSPQAVGGQVANAYRNQVAGVFRTAVSAGYYCCILQKGDNIAVKNAGSGTIGQVLIANSGTAADTTQIAVGSAFLYQVLGVERASTSGGNVNADLEIPGIP